MYAKVTILNKEELFNSLVSDLDKYIDTFLKEGIRITQPLVHNLAVEAIDNFYNSYHSIYYFDRTENLKKNSFKSICEYTGTGALVGVEINGENMSAYESGVNPSSVVGWSWSSGAHGYPGFGGTQRTFPPISMLQIAVGRAGQNILRQANQKAQSQKYKILKF